jgi:RimJ/RimL family protein N-acetyltransferase
MKPVLHAPELPQRTDRLRIEQLALTHVASLAPALCDARVYDYVQGSWPENADALTQKFERLLSGPVRRAPDNSVLPKQNKQLWWNYSVFRQGDNAGIGRLEATIVGAHAEIAYLLGYEYWQQGYGGEAVQWLLQALQSAGLRTVYATIYPSNVASEALLKKLGFDEIFSGWPELYSLDEGDRVFRKKLLR